MSNNIIHAESVMAVDFGSINTRAHLFDIVEGSYHFIASGTAPSTVGAPYYDVSESLRSALIALQNITGRILLDSKTSRLCMPAAEDGSGIDRLVVTMSAGRKLKILPFGILSDVSLKSARHLASSTYHHLVDIVGLGDNRPLDARLDDILNANPDIIILAGGTERGASRTVMKNASMVALICRLLPRENRPYVVYAGNRSAALRVKELLEKHTSVFITSNIRPAIDVEDLAPAQEVLADIFEQYHSQQIGGLSTLKSLCSIPLMPTAFAFSRMLRYLSHVHKTGKGVLGVDLGAGSTTLVKAEDGVVHSEVQPFGMGREITGLLEKCSLESISRWLPIEMSADALLDQIWNKNLFPSSIPATPEALAVEHAVARQALRTAVESAQEQHPDWGDVFEPILATGAVLGLSASPLQSLHILLDGIQPVGITTFILDTNAVLASLGAAAPVNSLLPVQVLESGAFTMLATVVSPVCRERFGTTVMQARLVYDSGDELTVNVKQGMIEVLPLPPGYKATLHLQSEKNVSLDGCQKRGKLSLKVNGAACGLVIDARGRPILLPQDDELRRSRLRRWAAAMDSFPA